MKLDKRQINALATSFYKEIKTKLNKTNKENYSKSLEKFRANYNKGVKILNTNKFIKELEICIGVNHYVDLKRNQSFENYTNAYSFRRMLEKDIDFNISDIEQDIVLATIDSGSIEDIMKVLKTKYK
jgi:hypothetical protein